MRSSILAINIALGSVLVMTNARPAHSQELTAVLEEAAIEVDGAKEPHRVPTYAKMEWFFSYYERNSDQLASSLGANDHTVLQNFAARNGVRRDVEWSDYVQTITPVCGGVDSMDASTLAETVERLTEEWKGRKTDRYLRILSTLSTDGQAIVERFIATNITPSITFSSSDARVIANKAPEYYKDGIRSLCKSMLEDPPELPSNPGVQPSTSGDVRSSSSGDAEMDISDEY